jgi:hypothetical protein
MCCRTVRASNYVLFRQARLCCCTVCAARPVSTMFARARSAPALYMHTIHNLTRTYMCLAGNMGRSRTSRSINFAHPRLDPLCGHASWTVPSW